ncbi:MAG TPA: DMT family transporter, partial [Rhodospirillales bacterium]|nr:DMT family transporter [Rhodospirillales bacterium]
LAVLVGFVGVYVILRPEFGGERFGYILGLGAGSCLGMFYMANRKLAEYQPQLVAVTYTAIFGTLLLLPVLPFVWIVPRLSDSALLGSFTSLAIIGQIFLISAFNYTNASTLAPFQYTQLIAATIVGLLIFDTFPDTTTWFGIFLIVFSGLYIALRETLIAKKGET